MPVVSNRSEERTGCCHQSDNHHGSNCRDFLLSCSMVYWVGNSDVSFRTKGQNYPAEAIGVFRRTLKVNSWNTHGQEIMAVYI